MATTSDRLGKQAMEVTKDLQEMGGIARDAAQEKLEQLRENASGYYRQGRDKVQGVVCAFRGIRRAAAAKVRIDRGRHRLAARSILALDPSLTAAPAVRALSAVDSDLRRRQSGRSRAPRRTRMLVV